MTSCQTQPITAAVNKYCSHLVLSTGIQRSVRLLDIVDLWILLQLIATLDLSALSVRLYRWALPDF